MEYSNVFNLVADGFKKEKIPCVLIGGFAVNYYKVTRQTADVDFLISGKDIKRALNVLTSAGYKTIQNDQVFARLQANRYPLMDIDLMFVDQDTLNLMMKDGQKVTITGKDFIVPSLNHLIALKLHSIKHNQKNREFWDLPDIINLVRENQIDVKESSFRDLCHKYGTGEIYQKIVEIMKN